MHTNMGGRKLGTYDLFKKDYKCQMHNLPKSKIWLCTDMTHIEAGRHRGVTEDETIWVLWAEWGGNSFHSLLSFIPWFMKYCLKKVHVPDVDLSIYY